ncbi:MULTISPECIES: hypothetical protein [unclassified Haladaptatus]|uniref:DUF7096 domain-containing protein n=1 Tax=unclassified Haladaptatus TaxID=2622732 RepID=UPI0023E76C8E|nr:MULTISPECIES: hypothetical protein [unclassified Haladaptatus]
MRRTFAFALALVVLLSSSAVAVPVAGPTYAQVEPVVPADNTTAYLTIAEGNVERTGYGIASLDVAATLSAQNDGLHARLNSLTLEERLATAGSEEERQIIIQSEADQLTAEVNALEKRKLDALSAYNSGDLTSDQLLRELATIWMVATALEDRVDTVESAADDITRSRIAKGISLARASLLELQGPIREHSALVVEGRATPRTVYLETSDSAIVLVTIAGDEYVREVSVPSARNPTAPDQYDGDLDKVESRAEELHPWALENSRSRNYGSPELGFVGIYPFQFPHSQGILQSYLDGGTGEIFYEIQHKDLDEVPTNAPQTTTNDSLTLTVETTHGSGPMNLTLVDADTGDPVDGTISINGQQVATTGEDGTVWVIQPRDRGTVIASANGRSVRASVA